jgi:hypothetical protein
MTGFSHVCNGGSKMRKRHKFCLIVTLSVVLLAVSAVTTVWADCPVPIYLGRDPTVTFDPNAEPGSKSNPAVSLSQAHDICKACPHSAIFEYKSYSKRYEYREACKSWYPEQDGVPLAQSVVMTLLALAAVGLLAWGVLLRRRVRRQPPS